MIKRELRNLFLQNGTILASLSFFGLVIFCVSLAFGPDEKILKRSGPVLLWTIAILTTFFSTPPLLKNEVNTGFLDEIYLYPALPVLYLLSKVLAEFILLGLPLIGLGAILTSFFTFSTSETITLSLTLLIGFPALSTLGILGGLLTLNARGGGILISLLILPLILPLLLLALSVMEMTRLGLDSFAPFCLLISVSMVLVIISLCAGSWALRFAVEG